MIQWHRLSAALTPTSSGPKHTELKASVQPAFRLAQSSRVYSQPAGLDCKHTGQWFSGVKNKFRKFRQLPRQRAIVTRDVRFGHSQSLSNPDFNSNQKYCPKHHQNGSFSVLFISCSHKLDVLSRSRMYLRGSETYIYVLQTSQLKNREVFRNTLSQK